jgi:hypothetical protein
LAKALEVVEGDIPVWDVLVYIDVMHCIKLSRGICGFRSAHLDECAVRICSPTSVVEDFVADGQNYI